MIKNRGDITFNTKNPALTGTIFFIFTLIMFFPTGLLFLNFSNSMSSGLLIVSIFLIFTFFFKIISYGSINVYRIAIFFILLDTVLMLHLLIASIINEVDFGRAFGSMIVLNVCIAASVLFAQLLIGIENSRIDYICEISLYLLLALGFLGAVHVFQPSSSDTYTKPVFPFLEPSHYALVLAPFLIFCCIQASLIKRYLYLVIVLLLALFMRNLTMVVVVLLATAVCFRGKHILIFSSLIVLCINIINLNNSYYKSRLDFSGDSINLSHLVYVQGWQLILESKKITGGWGYGFQQLGVFGTDVPAARTIFSLLGKNINLFDGSFNFSKIVSEFGIFGLVLSIFYLIYFYNFVAFLRKNSHYKSSCSSNLLYKCIFVSYFLNLFIRGIGYFDASSFLMMASIYSIFFSKQFSKPSL